MPHSPLHNIKQHNTAWMWAVNLMNAMFKTVNQKTTSGQRSTRMDRRDTARISCFFWAFRAWIKAKNSDLLWFPADIMIQKEKYCGFRPFRGRTKTESCSTEQNTWDYYTVKQNHNQNNFSSTSHAKQIDKNAAISHSERTEKWSEQKVDDMISVKYNSLTSTSYNIHTSIASGLDYCSMLEAIK